MIDAVVRYLADIQHDAENGDNISAHILEMELWEIVLLAVAGGATPAGDLVRMARLALMSRDINFKRWFE